MSTNPPPLLVPERIEIVKKIESKKCVFDLLTNLLIKNQNDVTRNEVFDALISREKLGSTCLGKGVAIPRAHLDIPYPRVALLVIQQGLDIETVDNKPIKLFLAIIVPNQQREEYVEVIKKLNHILTDDEQIKIFTETNNKEYLSNYFVSLFDNEINPEIMEDS